MVFLSSEQLNLIWSGSLVSWILDSNLQQDSGFLVLDSGFQSPGSGFQRQKIPGFRNPDSLTWGEMGKTAFGGPKNKATSTNDIDTTQGTPFLIYFLSVFMFIKELAFIINQSCCFSDPGGRSPYAPFPTGRRNALNLLKIVKLTQNVRAKNNIIDTNN